MSAAGNKGIPECNFLKALGIVNVSIKRKKGREANEKVNPIKCRANCIDHIPIFKPPVGVSRNGERFHKGRKVGKGEHDRDVEDGPRRARGIGRHHFSQQ